MALKFSAKTGLFISQEKVQIYGQFIWDLKSQKQVPLEAKELVEAGLPEESPLHDYFIWDNAECGDKYRIEQARQLLNHIEVIVEYDGKEEPIKAFHNVIVTHEIEEGVVEKKRGYVTVEEVRTNSDYYDSVVQQARERLQAWRKEYEQYRRIREFQPLDIIFEALDELQIRA